MQSSSAKFLRLISVPLLLILSPAILSAQSGTLTGKVIDRESKEPLSGATIRVLGSDATTRLGGAISGHDGSFTLKGVAPGTYRVVVSYVSYAPVERSGVRITSGETTSLDISMDRKLLGKGNQIVVSASRRPEKITSAPASVTVVDARQIEAQVALSTADHLRAIPGLDVVQSGLTQNNIVARGFNNAFSGTLMVLTDNRIASVPSLRFNAYNFIPLVNEDMQQIEVIRGPGAALYGPNTANGVLHYITRSPFSSAGTWVSATVGERDLFQGMARHAGTVGDRFGYKISGQYMRGEDWGFVDSAELDARRDFLADTNNRGVNPDTLRIAMRDSSIERVGGEVRFDIVPMDDMTMILAVGMNRALKNPDITGVGAAQSRDWAYTYYQARVLYKDLFLQAFLNRSDAGDSYLLRTGAPVVDRSSLFVAQAQHSYQIEDLVQLAYGADLLLTTPVTDSTITGSNENDDDITEVGAYLQGEVKIIPEMLNLVAAGRIDNHSRLNDPIFSPRAAIVFTPMEDQTVRLTYNRAYSAPTTNDMFLDIVVQRTPVFDVRASGLSQRGFTFRAGSDGRPQMRSSFFADQNAYLPIDSAFSPTVWQGIQKLVNAELERNGFPQRIDSVAPPPASVGLVIRSLNQATGAFDASGFPVEREPIRPTINSTIELGYQGILFDRIALGIDLYRSHYTDFIGTLGVVTPNVFFNEGPLRQHLFNEILGRGLVDTLTASILVPYLAQQIGGIAGDTSALGVPLGTISPEQASDPTAILFAPRNYGEVTLYGYDISLQVGVMEGLTVGGMFSYVDKNYITNLDGVDNLALNAPKFKFSLAGDYEDPGLGLNAALRFRHVDGFPVSSGVYIGTVPGYSVVDATIGYKLPWVPGLGLTLSAQNLLTFVEGSDESPFTLRHREFVGVPSLGRIVALRATYEFK